MDLIFYVGCLLQVKMSNTCTLWKVHPLSCSTTNGDEFQETIHAFISDHHCKMVREGDGGASTPSTIHRAEVTSSSFSPSKPLWSVC